MRILFVASEAVPYAKTGGLADVCGALPRALAARGHDVRLVMPRYRGVDTAGLQPLLGPLGVPTGAGERWCQVFEGRMPGGKVPVYFLEHDELFDRDELYGPPGEAYRDNCLRFTLLSRGALQLCHKLGWGPEVVHAHDWQSALVPIFLKTLEGGWPLGETGSVLTIHNLAYQGRFGAEELPVTGLGAEHMTVDRLEFYGGINLLKGGVVFADLVTTVSPSYAEEIRTPAFGELLGGVLGSRGDAVRGVLNGIDEEAWNPETDPLIPARFGPSRLEGKARCRQALCERFGLEPEAGGLVACFVGRLAEQKGVDLVIGAAPRLAELGVRVVALGAGSPRHEAALERMSAESSAFGAFVGFDEALAHLLYAGSDLLLMPSRYEPCGLNQLYAMRYGTVPIVTDVGGLRDSVVDPHEIRGPATGFKLAAPTVQALVDAVARAVETLLNAPEAFAEMVAAGMARRSGWDEAASEYEALYVEAAAQAVRRARGS